MKNKIKTPAEISAIRISGRMLADVLQVVTRASVPGITTYELGRIAENELKALGGKPAFKGYQGFPDVICISVNEEVVHGIPGKRVLAGGDIVGLDFGVVFDGMITDGAVTVPVGAVEEKVERLLKVTKKSLDIGIAQVRAGARTGDIGAAVEAELRRANLGVIEDLMGHGVGHELHEEPGIPNFGRAGTGAILRAGMTIAIEPMATLGGKEIVLAPDDWTISTADGSLGAQFEHTVLVTEDGAEVLTTPSL